MGIAGWGVAPPAPFTICAVIGVRRGQRQRRRAAQTEFSKSKGGSMNQNLMDDGMILLDTPFAKSIDFISCRFSDGYLWKKGNKITVSLIVAKETGKGYFRELIKNIEKAGFVVSVPNPLGHMQQILEHYGFVPHYEPFAPEIGENELVDVWERPKKEDQQK